MKSFFTTLPLLASMASAHLTFQSLWVDGAANGKMQTSNIRHNWVDPLSNYPMKDASLPEIACNKWGSTPAGGGTATVKAGSQVSAEFHHEPTQRAGDADEPIALSHKGPIMAYLGKVDDAATASPNGVKWFKIFEDTKDSSDKWAVERFYNNKGMVPFTIPSCVADGDYFLRVEVIGLHEADRANGAQMYAECAQISITGGGNAAPATVDFPGAYTNNGVGLSYNLYSGNAPYTAPGPRPFTCAAGGGSTAPSPSPAPAPGPSSSAPAPAPAPSSSRTPAPSPSPTTLSTSVRPVTTAPSGSSAPAPAPQPSSPAPAPGAPSQQEIETFFGQMMDLYNTWKAQVGA